MRDPKNIIINGKQLSEILQVHHTWLTTTTLEGRADLMYADLTGANLRNADLMYADLRDADLTGANLRNADLMYANLTGADLTGADLTGANLRDADLTDADLTGANLTGANLTGANLTGANLRDADLTDAKNAGLAIARTVIVPEGEIIGWKKCRGDGYPVIVKIKILEGVPRSNATGRKCRCASALDIAHYRLGDNEPLPADHIAYTETHGPRTEYKVGETITPDSWDEDRWNECSHGIHFFLTRAEAEGY